MNNQNLIIYQFGPLYQILKELEQNLNFKITHVSSEEKLNLEIKNLNNYLIITKNKILNIQEQYILDNMPVKIFKLVEKLNLQFLKLQFNEQSEIIINDYIVNLNSREISLGNIKLKLTEKEINTIIYLSKMKSPVTIDELQKKVWSYQSNIETHTVETHVYRLRKKMLEIFKDKNFLISKKNGYQIK
ncbi:MAG: winged helix-turn-helix domain-containing protein [Candidatus Pelagibacter sp.]